MQTTPEDQPPPPEAPNGPQLPPEQLAYFQASQHLVNMSVRFVATQGFCGPNTMLAQAIGTMQGNLMIRDLEMAALVQVLHGLKIIDQAAFFKRFVEIAAHVAQQLQAAAEKPQIVLAQSNARPRGP